MPSIMPVAVGSLVMVRLAGKPEGPLFPDSGGRKVSKFHLVKSWQDNLQKGMSGHSARRSGAMMHTRAGMDLASVSFTGRWKSSAVFRYVSDALEEMPLNAKSGLNGATVNPHASAAPFTPAAFTPALGDELGEMRQMLEEPSGSAKERGPEIQIVKVIEKGQVKTEEKESAGPAHQKPMWAISKAGRVRTRHLVTQASWGLSVDEWSTACGWHFAKYHVKVELTRTKVTGPKECQKCQAWMKGRDKKSEEGGVWRNRFSWMTTE